MCYIRQAATLASRPRKDLLSEIDHLEHQHALWQLKSSGKKRIPAHVSSKIKKELASPTLLSVHTSLQQNDLENAWKQFDTLTFEVLPRSTAHLLLKSLYTLVNSNLSRLTLDFGKLQKLYTSRLELLAGIVRRNKELHWDKHEAAMVIELYGKLDQTKKAESIFRNLAFYSSAPLNTEIFNELLAVYVRRLRFVDDMTKRRFLSKMKTLELEMARKGIQLNINSYNLLLAARMKMHDLREAEKIFSNMTCPPDRTTYHILLNGYLKESRNSRDKQITNKWMERLVESGIAPNKRTFKSVMDGLSDQVIRYAHLKETKDMMSATQSVSSIYQIMLQLGYEPDTETVNTMLKCYTAANDRNQIEHVLQMLTLPEKKAGGGCGNCGCGKQKPAAKEASKFKVMPDAFTYNILIKYYLANNNTDEAFQAYDTMVQLELSPDTVTYGNFIVYYADQGNVSECLKYVDVMQRKGIPSNNFIYNTLLNCSLKHPQHAGKIAPHLRSMLMDGSSTLDTVSQNIQLARFQPNEQDGFDANLEQFKDLLEQNLYANEGATNTRTYNTILHSAGQFYKGASQLSSTEERHQYQHILDSIIASLDTSQLHSDLYTYALTIRNASYAGNMNLAESTYKNMIDSGIKPNQFVFSHLIYGYTTAGKIERAHEVLKHMTESYGLTPSAINYAPLIKGYAEAAEYDKAHCMLREMLDKNVKADLVIYTILASVFLDSNVPGDQKRAIDLLEGLSKTGTSMDSASLTLLAEAYAIDAKFMLLSPDPKDNKALRQELPHHIAKINSIYTTLKENQWLDAKAITTLLAAHNHLRNPEGAWKLWNELKTDSTITLTLHHYNAILYGLTTTTLNTWYPIAKMIFDELVHDSHMQPDASTYDSMIWGAYGMSDYDSIRTMWRHMPVEPCLIRSYYASMIAMLNQNDTEGARSVYEAYISSSMLAPSSTAVWVTMINRLAIQQGFKAPMDQSKKSSIPSS
ncbi:hypothetical protein BD560DRAFT_436519 [Blakeslea trispora]|nr:hypothetical protein BD560DRAFT_436519 [Blakeslea trispora]